MEDNNLTSESQSLKSKRLVALIIDLTVCFLASLVITVIPIVNHYISWAVVFLILFLIKDALFDGRGIGKNILGIKLIDSENTTVISYKQSIIRNLVLVLPLLVYNLVLPIIALFVKSASVLDLINNIIIWVGALYFAIILLSEGYKVFILNDTLRLGDQMAKTNIIETDYKT